MYQCRNYLFTKLNFLCEWFNLTGEIVHDFQGDLQAQILLLKQDLEKVLQRKVLLSFSIECVEFAYKILWSTVWPSVFYVRRNGLFDHLVQIFITKPDCILIFEKLIFRPFANSLKLFTDFTQSQILLPFNQNTWTPFVSLVVSGMERCKCSFAMTIGK